MFRAIGFVIMLIALSKFFSQSFEAFDDATSASFHAAESAAVFAQYKIETQYYE
ncbi:hypothetical protein KC723_02480 [Candidatus Kaiserbacteria bacterium]|nr:hypothetical protein [Candidatus Kaiserbacteria bacterium]